MPVHGRWVAVFGLRMKSFALRSFVHSIDMHGLEYLSNLVDIKWLVALVSTLYKSFLWSFIWTHNILQLRLPISVQVVLRHASYRLLHRQCLINLFNGMQYFQVSLKMHGRYMLVLSATLRTLNDNVWSTLVLLESQAEETECVSTWQSLRQIDFSIESLIANVTSRWSVGALMQKGLLCVRWLLVSIGSPVRRVNEIRVRRKIVHHCFLSLILNFNYIRI